MDRFPKSLVAAKWMIEKQQSLPAGQVRVPMVGVERTERTQTGQRFSEVKDEPNTAFGGFVFHASKPGVSPRL